MIINSEGSDLICSFHDYDIKTSTKLSYTTEGCYGGDFAGNSVLGYDDGTCRCIGVKDGRCYLDGTGE
jgi:hypothetical protein